MAIILALETTTTNCSVVLAKDGHQLAVREDNNQGYSHAEKLHLFIEQVTDEAGIVLSQLDAVAVSKGPGSYTGLRIGVSAAKGLCFSLNIPLIAVATLDTLAKKAQKIKDCNYIIPLLDARRMEVFTAVYDHAGKQIDPTKAEVLTENSYSDYLEKGKVIFIGNAVEKFKKICHHSSAFFYEEFPSAKEMIAIAEAKYKISDIEDVAYFEPYYLKDFVVTKKKN